MIGKEDPVPTEWKVDSHGCVVRALVDIFDIKDIDVLWARRKSDLVLLEQYAQALYGSSNVSDREVEQQIWEKEMVNIVKMVKEVQASDVSRGKEAAKKSVKKVKLTALGVAEAIFRGMKAMVMKRYGVSGHAMSVIADESRPELFISASDLGRPAMLASSQVYDVVLFADDESSFNGMSDLGSFHHFDSVTVPSRWSRAILPAHGNDSIISSNAIPKNGSELVSRELMMEDKKNNNFRELIKLKNR